jgi:hypothetical protein
MSGFKTICITFIAGSALIAHAAGQTAKPASAHSAVRPATIPRLSDGKPNFNGIWQSVSGADVDLQDHIANAYAPGAVSVIDEHAVPYRQEAIKQREDNFKNRETADTETAKCNLPGVPRITYAHDLPFQIFQKPKGDKITILYEYAEAHRFLYTNGTDHPPGHINWELGDSRSKWDGDTLVVDSVDFTDTTWFDHAGDYHSQELHVIERYKLLDADHIDYQVEIEDPKVFSRPWHFDITLYRRVEKNFQLLDYVCYAFPIEKYYP